MRKAKKTGFNYRTQRKTFFVITGLIILLFIIFQFIGNITSYEYPNPKESLDEGRFSEHLVSLSEEMKTAYNYETQERPSVIVISETFEKTNMEISSVLETLEGMKILHQCVDYTEVEGLNVEEIPTSVQLIIVCGDKNGNALQKAQLEGLTEKGIAILYTQMPEADAIRTEDLMEFFGIFKLKGKLDQKGMRFVDDVFAGGVLDLYDMEYSLEDVSLESTCKIFAYGLKGRTEEEVERNENLPPLMWRNRIDDSKIYVVNGKFFEENKGYGILAAVLSDIYEDFIYPIVNASVMIYDSIPYDGVANEELMKELYSRNSLQFQTDILMPNLVSICKRLDVVPTFYTSAGHQLPEMEYFERSVLDLGGELIYEEDAQVKAIDITNPEGRIWDECPNLPVIVTGFEKNDSDMTKLYSIGSTFGIVVHRVDISKIINADSTKMDWVTVSKDYSDYIAYYQEDFGSFDSVKASEAAIRYMEYMLMKPSIVYEEKTIKVDIEHMPKQASFILRTDKEVEAVVNGSFEKLEKNMYLIKTNETSILIQIKDADNRYYQGNY